METSLPVQPESVLTRRPFQIEAERFIFADYYTSLRIFRCLKVEDLLRAASVCRSWKQLAMQPSLWKTVRMKGRCQVTDWDGFAGALKRHGTEHLDLREMCTSVMSDSMWQNLVAVIPRVTNLVKLELCWCPAFVIEEVIKNCPQLEELSAMSIRSDCFFNLESVGNLKRCRTLKLKAVSWIYLDGDLSPLQTLTQLTHLSLTTVLYLGMRGIDILESLTNLETLELGDCSDFPKEFGTRVLPKLHKLKRLRLEEGTHSCCTFEILEGVSKLENLSQLELVNFDVKNGFDKCLANCKNIKRLLIIPSSKCEILTENNMVLGGVTELSNNLTHFVWGVSLELAEMRKRIINKRINEQVTGDCILISRPLPCLRLIGDIEDNSLKGDDKVLPNQTHRRVDFLPLSQLQKILLTALPKTRVTLLKIPSHDMGRQTVLPRGINEVIAKAFQEANNAK